MANALSARTAPGEPPSMGQSLRAAYFMPGRRTSTPKRAEPSTLAARSRRGAGRPMIFQSLRSFRVTGPGGVAAAYFAICPYVADLPEGCEITPSLTDKSSIGSFHCNEAAPTRQARAVAAAVRTTSHASATLDEPPVALIPSSRASLPTTQRPALTRPKPSSASASSGWNGRLATSMATLP